MAAIFPWLAGGAVAGAGFALLRGLPIEQCLRYANAAGAENLAGLDSLSGLRSWEETTQLLARKAWPLRWNLVAGAILIEAVMLAALVLP